jgi:hypothetical protein
VDLGDVPHDSQDQVLNKEVTVFLNSEAVLDPFDALSQSIFVQS